MGDDVVRLCGRAGTGPERGLGKTAGEFCYVGSGAGGALGAGCVGGHGAGADAGFGGASGAELAGGAGDWHGLCGDSLADFGLVPRATGLLRQPLGQRILRYASLDDVAIWGVLARILLDWARLGRQAWFIMGFAMAARLLRMLMPKLRLADRWYIGLIWPGSCGFAADWAGLHFMVGAFLSGAVLEAKWFDIARVDTFREAVLLAFMPVFFLSTGLKTSWEIGGPMVFQAAGLLLVASVGGKLAGVHLAGRILGWTRAETRVIGWLLQTKTLIMIIFANILLDKAIISPATFTALLLMAVASTLLTMPIVTRRLAAFTPL